MQRGVGGAALRPRLTAAGSAPAPHSVPRSPRARPHCGASAGANKVGAWAAPFGGPLSPARAPSGPLAGRSWVVAGPGSAPPRGGLPAALGGACRCSPLRVPPSAALWPLRVVGVPAAPPPARGGVAPLCPRRLCPWPSVLFSPLPPGGLLPLSPSRPPPPPGAGEAQEVNTPLRRGRAAARLPLKKQCPPACGSPHPAKRHKTRILFN